MYLIVNVVFNFLKCSSILFLRNNPISLFFTFPLKSFTVSSSIRSCPKLLNLFIIYFYLSFFFIFYFFLFYFFTSPLCNYYDSMPTFFDSVFKPFQNFIDGERNFRKKNQIYISIRQWRKQRNKPTVSPK